MSNVENFDDGLTRVAPKGKFKSGNKMTEEKPIYTKIPELGIEVSQQMYNEKTYSEILKLVKEKQIATHNILYRLRKLTKKYPQFIDFRVFIPNPDLISKKNGYVVRFGAFSIGSWLDCNWYPQYSCSALGVFLWRKLKK